MLFDECGCSPDNAEQSECKVPPEAAMAPLTAGKNRDDAVLFAVAVDTRFAPA